MGAQAARSLLVPPLAAAAAAIVLAARADRPAPAPAPCLFAFYAA